MEEEPEPIVAGTATAALSAAKNLVPIALERAHSTTGFCVRWNSIISKLEQVPLCLSDLSSHPCFTKNSLCLELLHSVASIVSEAIHLADLCNENGCVGKLQMQSDLDALSGKLDLILRDCRLLIKTGVLGALDSSGNIQELLARLQIGHSEAKHWAVEGLLEAMKDDEKTVTAVLGRANIASLIGLLTATTPVKTREKATAIVCRLVECSSCEQLLITEGLLPSLIRLAESGTTIGREKAVISLQRLSMSAETARSIVGHGGVRPLIEICQSGDSVSLMAAAGALKNLSGVPEVRQNLSGEGVIRVMINLLDSGVILGSKDYAAECLQNLSASNGSLRRCIVSEGGIKSLLNYMNGPLPQEPAVAAVRNLVGSVSIDTLLTLGLLPRLVHALTNGSPGAQQASASTICKISNSTEMKKLIGDSGCIIPLVRLLEAKSSPVREAAAQALVSLMSCPQNCREVKKMEKSVMSLVMLLDPSPQNTAKKYAVLCLLSVSVSKKCRKAMVSYGAVGYLKKLAEMEVAGAKKLVEKLERRKLMSLFSRK